MLMILIIWLFTKDYCKLSFVLAFCQNCFLLYLYFGLVQYPCWMFFCLVASFCIWIFVFFLWCFWFASCFISLIMFRCVLLPWCFLCPWSTHVVSLQSLSQRVLILPVIPSCLLPAWFWILFILPYVSKFIFWIWF